MEIKKELEIPEWLYQRNMDENIYETWMNYITSRRNSTLEDWTEINLLLLSYVINEYQYATHFEESCYAITGDEEAIKKILSTLPEETSYVGWEKYCIHVLEQTKIPFYQDIFTSLTYFISSIDDIKEMTLAYQLLQTLLLNRIDASRAFSKAIYENYGEEIYNEIIAGTLFSNEVQEENKLLACLRASFPEKEELTDEEILTAFEKGEFDDILQDESIFEYFDRISGEKDDYQTKNAVNSAEYQTALDNLQNNLRQVYGPENKALKYLELKIEKWNSTLSDSDKIQKAIEILESTKEMIRELHGSIGLRKVIQYGQEPADKEDMENFTLTSMLYGEEKAKELLRLTRQTVAEYWNIPYDDALLDTPIDSWEDNPGR